MGEIVAAILNILRMILIGPWWAKLIGVSIVIAIAVAIYLDNRKQTNKIRALPFAGVSLNGEIKTLHIIPSGCPMPKNISEHLRGFQNAGELYYYAYQEFDESLFDTIVIHSASMPPATFACDESLPDEENLARLHAQLIVA